MSPRIARAVLRELRGAPAEPDPLSPRERQLLKLVDEGLTYKQIAERLVMSVRSVEGHLYRACQRVGASSREQLAAIIRRGPKGVV